MKTFKIFSLATTLLFALVATNAFASNLTDKDDQVEQAGLDSQVEEMDGYSYDDYANQTNIETNQLNKDLTSLKSKIERLKAQKLEAEKRAKRSSESYNVTKQEKQQTEKQAKRFEQILAKEQREVSRLEKRLDAIKDQKSKAEERSKKAKESLSQVEQQRRDLLKQQRELTASIEKQIRIKKALDKKRMSKVAEVYRLHANVRKLQAQSERLQQRNQEKSSKSKVATNE